MLLLVGLLAALFVAINVGVRAFDGTVFDDPPESYATYRGDGATFRYPKGWQVTEADRSVTVSPSPRRPGGPVIVLTWMLAPKDGSVASEAARRLLGTEPFEENAYEIDVPRASAADAVAKRRTGERWRATAVAIPRGPSVYVLTARDEVDGPRDARVIAGTLRLTG